MCQDETVTMCVQTLNGKMHNIPDGRWTEKKIGFSWFFFCDDDDDDEDSRFINANKAIEKVLRSPLMNMLLTLTLVYKIK